LSIVLSCLRTNIFSAGQDSVPFNPLVLVGIIEAIIVLKVLALDRVVENVQELDVRATEMLVSRRSNLNGASICSRMRGVAFLLDNNPSIIYGISRVQIAVRSAIVDNTIP